MYLAREGWEVWGLDFVHIHQVLSRFLVKKGGSNEPLEPPGFATVHCFYLGKITKFMIAKHFQIHNIVKYLHKLIFLIADDLIERSKLFLVPSIE